MSFSLDDIPDQTGKNIIITGASSGIGLSASRMLAKKGAHIVMACRNLEKAQPLADSINEDSTSSGGRATVIRFDTTDLASIDSFAEALDLDRLDSLILNAGIMAVPYREVPTRSTKHPKMESQMACNVVGHFYLVHKLTPLLRASPGVRIVPVSSMGAKWTRQTDSITYDVVTCSSPASYVATSAYSESKLGNLLFAHELNHRLVNAGIDASVAPMHPGTTNTDLGRDVSNFMLKLLIPFANLFTMSVDGGGEILAVAGTLPTERLPENPYFGPKGLLEYNGPPIADGKMPPQGRDGTQSKKLWEMCEELCGVKTEF